MLLAKTTVNKETLSENYFNPASVAVRKRKLLVSLFSIQTKLCS